MTFSGKTVVITGASMGIGEAMAAAFAREGAHVILAARSAERLREVAARIDCGRGRIVPIAVDVTNHTHIEDLVQQSLSVTGRVDVLINNAGVGMNGAVERIDLAEWRRCLEVNLVAPVQVVQAFLPAMKAAGAGTIVQVSSVLGKVSVPYTAGYNASKYALNAVSDALRLEVARYGIHVVSVYPGSTESNFRSNSLGQEDAAKVRLYRMPASAVADKVVQAVRTGRRDVYVTWRDAALCWFGTRWPRLADWALKKAYQGRN